MRGTRIGTVFLAPLATVFFLCLWHLRVSDAIGIQAVAAYVLLTLLFTGYGRIFVSLLREDFVEVGGFPLQLISGYFIFNTFLFVLTVLSPLGMLVNIAIMSCVCVAGLLLVRRRMASIGPVQNHMACLLAIVVSGIAATIWVSDSQAPLVVQDGMVVFRTWQDSFIHVREISEFAQARGVSTIHDLRLAGAPAPIYHFASYVSAATVSLLSSLSAWETYSGFQLPFGIFLTGLAAFSLIATLFGRWPALAAAMAVVLLPDAFHQGFGNRYLSYSFLSQVNLGMLYGISCAAIAWIFMIEGCRRSKYAFLILSYVFLIFCLFYKAHVFVANAFLILMYPCVFFTAVRPRIRLVLGVFAIALFVAVIALSQATGKVPLLRLNFSSTGQYVVDLLNAFDNGVFKEFYTRIFLVDQPSKAVQGFYALAMISLSTFGVWLLAFGVAAPAARKRIAPAAFWFPVVVLVNYLVMATGLAYDNRGIGTPDEMINRPLVWAYFVIAAWTAGASYFVLFGNRVPARPVERLGIVVATVMAMSGPLAFNQNLQTFPARKMASYAEFNAAPACLVEASQYIRTHSNAGDIIQDSANDLKFMVTALAERQSFVIGSQLFGKTSKPVEERIAALAGFMAMNDAGDIQRFAGETGIAWFLLRPENKVAWPDKVLNDAKFECGGYKVFHFSPA